MARLMRGTLLLAFAAFLWRDGSAAPDPRLAAAIPAIESTIKKSGADVAVAFRTLDGRTQWLRRPDEPFHAASTMKVAVLIELYRQARQGKLKLDDPL
ncbi:MAG: serine hydrolase, partial [Gammaproteobacteria bacterium]